MGLETVRSHSLSYGVVFWKYLDMLIKGEGSSSFSSFIPVFCKSFLFLLNA